MSASPTVLYVFERYPALSQTFLRREIAGLRAQGVRIEILSLFTPGKVDRTHALEDAPVDYFRWWETAMLVVALPRELLRDHALLRDGWRLWRQHRPTNSENFWTTVWSVIVAICRANRVRCKKPDIVHGVWATGPATTAAILSRLCDIPFSFGGHAYDIYRHGGDAFLEPKLQAASLVHTTTEAGAVYLRERAGGCVERVAIPNSPPTEGLGVGSPKIILARRGLDQLPSKPTRDSSGRPIRLLSVGRLVPKKGHAHQLAACALLKSWGVPFNARIVGDGPLQDELRRRIDHEKLGDAVTLCGEFSPNKIAEQYRWADIFWHTGVVDSQGDRDGLPNVIPEAFAYCLPIISSRTPGPMEAVAHEVSGLIVNVSDAAELASAAKRLAGDPTLRQRLGENGRRWVEENFLISRNTEILARAFQEASRR